MLRSFDCGDIGWGMVGRTSDELRPSLRGRSFCVLKTDQHIGVNLARGQYWEEWMYDVFKAFYEKDTDMVDIGAHIGTSALLMEEVCSEGCTVHAFEPIFHRLITHTLQLNNISNERVRVHPLALGQETKMLYTTIKNWTIPTNFGASALDHNELVPRDYDYFGNIPVQIPVAKLNIDASFARRVSVIKIDVEGMEQQVILGIMELIQRDRPVILIEVWNGPALESFAEFYNTHLVSTYELKKIQQGCDDYILIPISN
jgi:FkbM family methyltransferase